VILGIQIEGDVFVVNQLLGAGDGIIDDFF
jgi:hypothetical protein